MKNITKMLKIINKKKLKNLSPNEINLLAWKNNIKNLKSEDVVFLSNNS